MSREDPPADDVLARLGRLLGLGDRKSGIAASIEDLRRQTRHQLLEWSNRLGLVGVSRLTREALADLLLQALGVGEERLDAAPRNGDLAAPADVARKFDLGRPAERVATPEHIPWSYGQDRVTATAVDPDRLYVYWEVTDETIARARTGLGTGGPEAWLDLRVYDVTGRLFDGTNALGYTDHKVERSDRQWFFDVGRPASTAVVEIGLKSLEGYFVRIARSGRVDFPRREPAPPGGVEWLTVRTASGELAPPVPAPGSDAALPFVPTPAWNLLHAEAGHEGGVTVEERLMPGEAFQERREWQETFRTEWRDGERTLAWGGPAVRTTWEAGPFAVPIESPAYVEERHDGTVHVQVQDGRTRVVYGPWQVVIHGLGARAERQVVATWELHRAWVTTGSGGRAVAGGAPVAGGASEVRLGGASEVWRLGASEIRFLGASERLYPGASERAYGGASEQRPGGASEAPLPYPGARRAAKG